MFVSSSALPVLALSLDGAKTFALDLYDHMQRDWWATAYWSGVWVCGFIATFLLIRMLFTHWGDRDVMKKTLGLSLIVHMLVGMLSTTVMFGPGSSGSEELEEVIAIRRVVVSPPAEESMAPAGEERAAANERKLPGKSPAWEQSPKFDSRQAARLDREAHEPSRDVDFPPDRKAAADSLSIPAPDLADRPERDDPPPTPDRQIAKLNRPAERTQTPIAEETADARPEVGAKPGPPARGARAPAGSSATEVARRARPETTDKVPISIEEERDIPEPAVPPDPLPRVARGAETRESPRVAHGSPKSPAVDDSAPDETSRPNGAGTTAPAIRPLSRIGRPGRDSADAESPERTRPGEPGARSSDKPSSAVSGSSSVPGADPLVAGISPGGAGSEGLVPSLVRSEIEGAIGKNGGKVPATYRLRTSPARKKIALDMGANEDSERAVEASLQWLADHQNPRGFWQPIESTLGKDPGHIVIENPENIAERERSGINSETGLTALATLAFLGKGYTHEDNAFSENVDRALHWLISQQDARGFLGGRANHYARMYCHGMATIAIGEAYGMTKDHTLREPLARAVQFIVDSQNSDGGWRYFKGKEGDMSMFGWQLMALKSAKTAGLAVPQATMNRAIDFLIAHGDDLKARRLSQFGGLAAYRRGDAERPKPSMTAESLFCKQMLGIKRTNRASLEAVEYLLKNLPQRSKQDLYYWYYGTLAMYHHGGDSWNRWNQALRDNLVADQRTDGDFAGSWNPRAPWGDYGGRVFSTALSTLSLEVYYRFLPLYQSEEAGRLDQSADKR